MKNKSYRLFISVFLLTLIGLPACKNKDLDVDSFEIERENVVTTADSVRITGSYSFAGTVKRMKVNIGEKESLIDANAYEMQMEGTEFSVSVGGLKPSTEYYYRYSIDFGTNDAHLTETKSFTTLDAITETPTVKTLEILAIDSTTFRIKCEVVSDGGQEVTERGICWNTYGDPTMDDETIQHANGGLGQYTLRLENLSTSTKYYVRAYAKNATGISLGEVLDFRTGSEALLPQVSTVEVSEVTFSTATCLGNVSSNGGLELTERGVCWGLEPYPTINIHHTVADGTETGNYTVTIIGLAANTTYHVRCYATNEKGTSYGEELTFTTTQGLPTVTTSAITDITATSAIGGGEVTDQGASNVTERGICWSTSHNPTTSGSHVNSGSGLGNFTASMTGLTLNTTYYVRAYATNAQGTAYGAEVGFTAIVGLPVVQTLEVTDITASNAKAHGKVIDQGGSVVTERGICWSTNPSPTVNNSHANSGTGIGEYTISLTNLAPGTYYYVRAYAKNDQGIAYGEQMDFQTQATLPTVQIISIDGSTVNYKVSGDGGAAVTEHGVCWSTSHNPTTSGNHASGGSGIGSFTVELTNLEPGTTYYVRVYGTNNVGTAYSNELNFTTTANLPSVITGEVSNITQTSAQGNGNVTDDGGATVTERGLCWSTSHNPTITNSHSNASTGGLGNFMVNITGLTTNTKYYVKAYAKNSTGIVYGNEVSFTTSQDISAPTVTTAQVTNIQQTSATGGGNITNDGGAMVTERGICWSTNHNPTTSGSHISNGTGPGNYTCIMNGLTGGTTYYVRAYAINSQGTSYGDEVSFSTPGSLPTVTTSQVTNITQSTASGGGNVTNAGSSPVTERGICWSTSHNPTINNSHSSGGAGLGMYQVQMTSLTSNTTYYVRAFATNSTGTAYGAEVTFTTLSNLPTVTTNPVTNITQTTATGGGNVTSTGGADVTERGICWSTSHNPTTSGNHATSGTGPGNYTVNMNNLTANTTYYVRAYAINSAGTQYGSEVTFVTLPNLPTLTTSPVTNITQNSATGGGNVTNDGGATVTVRGICWSTSHNPTTNNSHQSSGAGTGNFTVNMTNLTANTTYYVRAFATNSGGTAYGDEVMFVTLPNLPTVSTVQISNVTQTSATATANVSSGINVTERGVCWSTSPSPTISGSHANSGSGTGSFSVNMTGLSAGTTYYVRAYAINNTGTNYGSEVNFTTIQPTPTGAINGLFSVSATQQVWFSQGNLQYRASTNTWRFATNQYDYVGEGNANISQTYNGWIDLFGWGTSGYNHGAVCYQPWSTSTNQNDYFAYGSETYNLFDQTGQADWGYNPISNGGNQTNYWRTLTYGEWYCVCNTRNTTSGIRYAKAKVNNINGLILLPDNWSATTFTLSSTNSPDASFSSNVISLSQWAILENAGAVFLPAAGCRGGTSGTYLFQVSDRGYYWSSSYWNTNNGNYATALSFGINTEGNNFLGFYTNNRSTGHSVRLVRSAQ
jgi:hypothetical protein